MGDRTYTTGLTPATPAELRGLADAVEGWRRDDISAQHELEARVFAALRSAYGWEYLPPKPYVPPVKEGRKIVQPAQYAVGPRIQRQYTIEGNGRGWGRGSGSEWSPAPHILTDMGLAWGLLHGRVLLHLSDISADGLPAAHVGGGPEMRAEGKAHCTATVPAALVAAILRCEAMAREIAQEAGHAE